METTVNTTTEGRPDFISIRDFSFFYGKKQALFDISLDIPERQVTAFIGPSGCGKSTLLRNLNRMNDLIDGIRHSGDIVVNGRSIYDPHIEVISLRKRVGMVFSKIQPLPEIHLRKCRLPTPGLRAEQKIRPRRNRGTQPPRRRAMG